MSLFPLDAIRGLLKLGDGFLFTRKLCPVLFFWQKRAAGRLFERSGIAHVCDGLCQSLWSGEFGVGV